MANGRMAGFFRQRNARSAWTDRPAYIEEGCWAAVANAYVPIHIADKFLARAGADLPKALRLPSVFIVASCWGGGSVDHRETNVKQGVCSTAGIVAALPEL